MGQKRQLSFREPYTPEAELPRRPLLGSSVNKGRADLRLSRGGWPHPLVPLMTEPTVSSVLGYLGHLGVRGHERDSSRSVAHELGRRSALMQGAGILPRSALRDERGTTSTRIGSTSSTGDAKVDKVLRWRLGHSR